MSELMIVQRSTEWLCLISFFFSLELHFIMNLFGNFLIQHSFFPGYFVATVAGLWPSLVKSLVLINTAGSIVPTVSSIPSVDVKLIQVLYQSQLCSCIFRNILECYFSCSCRLKLHILCCILSDLECFAWNCIKYWLCTEFVGIWYTVVWSLSLHFNLSSQYLLFSANKYLNTFNLINTIFFNELTDERSM